MEAITGELALRYLLELSTDIRSALLLDERGELIAAAPERPTAGLVRLGSELMRAARSFARDEAPVEVDVKTADRAVFLVDEGGPALICLTGRFVLPALILYEMRAVLNDLSRAASTADAGLQGSGSVRGGS
jgi:hypothetical protein